ncbi:MAG: DUF3048 domain-containing protein, partial [Bacillota bacterium]|nr:DUF3048 domain-containing protein [Bacillota bacterium]
MEVPPDKGAQISPLTGNLLDSERRSPIQVLYSPKEANEPLSGINNADLIFEYLAESGKPEYTAIFHDKIPAKTSPIKQL